MTRNEIDVVDVAPLIALPIFSGMVFGVWTFGISVFGGYQFTDALFTVGGTSVSTALLGAVGAIVAIIATNEIDGSNYEGYEYAGIVTALAITPAYEFVPAVQSLVNSHDILALGAWLLVAALATFVAYWE